MAAGSLTSHIDRFREAALSCPIPAAVELIGEKWAFLILRGALNGLQHFEEFQAGLGIARNILSDRLAKMVAGGILKRTPDPSDKRRVIYSLTAKGIGLAPVLTEMVLWAAAHEDTGNQALVRQMKKGKEQFISEVRKRLTEGQSGTT